MTIKLTKVNKTFGVDQARVLSDVSFEIPLGQFTSLTGRSGSGKSTLLYIMSSLDKPTSGSVELMGKNVASMKQHELHAFRNMEVGFVFQFHYLLPELTALENVLMPAMKTNRHHEKDSFAMELLGRFDLGNKAHRLPRQLSGGEQQRVAIARSLVMKPKLLFADEPTGSLDSINGKRVMQIFNEINQQDQTTIVLVTHEPFFAAQAPRQIELADGKVIRDELKM